VHFLQTGLPPIVVILGYYIRSYTFAGKVDKLVDDRLRGSVLFEHFGVVGVALFGVPALNGLTHQNVDFAGFLLANWRLVIVPMLKKELHVFPHFNVVPFIPHSFPHFRRILLVLRIQQIILLGGLLIFVEVARTSRAQI